MPQLKVLFIGYCFAVVLLYWLIPTGKRGLFLALGSSLFLAFLDRVSFAVLLALTVTIYYSSRNQPSRRNYMMVLSALLLLFCGVRVAQLLQRADQPMNPFILLGFGYYVLKLIHYLVESHRGMFRPHRFLDFFNYMLFSTIDRAHPPL
jgi:hypothetical protein